MKEVILNTPGHEYYYVSGLETTFGHWTKTGQFTQNTSICPDIYKSNFIIIADTIQVFCYNNCFYNVTM